MAEEFCTEVQTKTGSAFVCSPFEKTASLVVDSLFKHPFGCPAFFQREELTDCNGYTKCTIVHCPSECVAPEGFVAEVDDCVDAVYVRDTEIGRPSRGDKFYFKGQKFLVDAVTGCCGYTWRTIVTELDDQCDTQGCADGIFD